MSVTYGASLRFDRGWMYYIRAVAHGRVVGGATYSLSQRRTASLRTLRQAIAAAFPGAAHRDAAAWVASKYGQGWDTASHYRRIKMNTYKITIYYDDSDTANLGWAYSIRSYDRNGTYLDESSGPLPQSRRNASLRALRRALARTWGAFPQAARHDGAWVGSEEGGWQCSASPGTDWKIHVMPHGPHGGD